MRVHKQPRKIEKHEKRNISFFQICYNDMIVLAFYYVFISENCAKFTGFSAHISPFTMLQVLFMNFVTQTCLEKYVYGPYETYT